jgi:hypothetical protein
MPIAEAISEVKVIRFTVDGVDIIPPIFYESSDRFFLPPMSEDERREWLIRQYFDRVLREGHFLSAVVLLRDYSNQLNEEQRQRCVETAVDIVEKGAHGFAGLLLSTNQLNPEQRERIEPYVLACSNLRALL